MTRPVTKGKHLLRNAGAALLYAFGATRPSGIPRDRLAIVTLHRVLPREYRDVYPLRSIAVTPETLARLLEFFSEHFECMTLGRAASLWQEGYDGDRPLLAVTFDDGQEDNFLYARPLLAKFGVPATFFVPVNPIDDQGHLWHDRIGFGAQRLGRLSGAPLEAMSPYLGRELRRGLGNALPARLVEAAKGMTPPRRARLLARLGELLGEEVLPAWSGMMRWSQIRTLASEGHEIGSHGATHAILLERYEPDLGREVGGSRQRLEEVLAVPVRSFSFPNGNFDEAAIQAVHDAGYEWAVTTRPGLNPRGTSSFALRRFDIQQELNQTFTGRLSVPVLSWRLRRKTRA